MNTRRSGQFQLKYRQSKNSLHQVSLAGGDSTELPQLDSVHYKVPINPMPPRMVDLQEEITRRAQQSMQLNDQIEAQLEKRQ